MKPMNNLLNLMISLQISIPEKLGPTVNPLKRLETNLNVVLVGPLEEPKYSQIDGVSLLDKNNK